MKFDENIVIAFEGIDGSGKNTQSKKLVEYFKQQGKNVIFQDFPTYTAPGGVLLGRYLNGELKNTYHKPSFLASLYAMDRFEFISSIEIKPGDYLVFDRFTYSALAYQSSFANEESELLYNWLWDIEFNFMKLPEADLVIWLDISPEVSQKMVLKKAARNYTDKGMDLHEGDLDLLAGARQGYANMQEKIPDIMKRVVCDDGEDMLSIEDIFEQVLEHVNAIQKKI